MFSYSSELLDAFKVAFVFLWVRLGRAWPGAAFVGGAVVSVINGDMQTQNLRSSLQLVGGMCRAALSRSFNWLIHLQSK